MSPVDFFAQDVPVPAWLIALVAVVVIVARALDTWSGNREARAREAEAATVALHAAEVTDVRAELKTLCDQARDHVAVLEEFRRGWDLTADHIESAETLALLTAAADVDTNAAREALVRDLIGHHTATAERVAREITESTTTALPIVHPDGPQTSGQA